MQPPFYWRLIFGYKNLYRQNFKLWYINRYLKLGDRKKLKFAKPLKQIIAKYTIKSS